jgi:hypothetical protein
MSEEDKRKQVAKEFKEAVNGLALKYLDGQIDLDRFQAEFSRLGEGPSAKADAAAEIAGRINPAADNRLLLDLIRHGLGGDISGIEAILSDFHRTAQAEDARAVERIRTDMFKRGILGSAMVPNLEKDKNRAGRLGEMLAAFEEELAEQIAQLRRSMPQAR